MQPADVLLNWQLKLLPTVKPTRPPVPNTAAESPSLNLMRKFPPRSQEATAGRKNGVSDLDDAEKSTLASGSGSRAKSDAASKNKIVIKWRDNRSKSADRGRYKKCLGSFRARIHDQDRKVTTALKCYAIKDLDTGVFL